MKKVLVISLFVKGVFRHNFFDRCRCSYLEKPCDVFRNNNVGCCKLIWNKPGLNGQIPVLKRKKKKKRRKIEVI